LIFTGCRTAIDMLWDWGWTWKNLIIGSTEYGIKMHNEYKGGSILLLDSAIIGTPTGISIDSPVGGTPSEKFTVTLDNVQLLDVGTALTHKTAGVTLEGGSRTIRSWVMGKVYDEKDPRGRHQAGVPSAMHPTTGSLMSSSGYFSKGKPQYANYDALDFINARDYLATGLSTLFLPHHLRANARAGDGVTDDYFQLQIAVFIAARLNRPLYVPFGSYIVSQTLKIPVGSVIVGECWAQIVATGAVSGSKPMSLATC
jgi:hypothetical protein